ncbi:MAG: isochorismatase family protein [Flavobacteriales bacterium]|nr:isochorismatase family protein [Flavobacteriales bacterium]
MDILLIIDMQGAAFDASDKFDSDGVVSRINHLSKSIRENQGKVVFIQHDGTEEEGLSPNTPTWEIAASLLKSDADAIIRKTTNDAFCNTELHSLLTALNPKKLIISGWATDLCVDSTIRSAVSLVYHVVVASDCHTVSNRPHLRADKIIEHHNWVWRNLITSGNSVEVAPQQLLCR